MTTNDTTATTEPMTVARQLAMLVGKENARTAIEAGWAAIRSLNAEHTNPLVHPGVADYVATAAILAAVEAGLCDTAELTTAHTEGAPSWDDCAAVANALTAAPGTGEIWRTHNGDITGEPLSLARVAVEALANAGRLAPSSAPASEAVAR
ncbi:hypothetical protein ABZ793_12045 [Micromonospora sp. NPDC047465]|uniref:hypothetical protein n=1 Tax=Micromonospora sp. NPDC047465 TaxID=3154813 RepID=UPI0033FFA005